MLIIYVLNINIFNIIYIYYINFNRIYIHISNTFLINLYIFMYRQAK